MASAHNALIPIFTGTLGSNVAQLVDARTLHRFLEVDTRFNVWISRRIEEYGFEEHHDFIFAAQNWAAKRGGHNRREYHLTLDMAKEISMVERNKQGRLARRYFIECEKRLTDIDPSTAASIARTTIGTDGMRCLSAVVEGKLKQLPGTGKRAARTHLWAQVHKAFSVVTAEDIPADQLDSARNFIAAYALEGQWLPAPANDDTLVDADQVNLYALCSHMLRLHELYRQYHLREMFEHLQSPIGPSLYGHLTEGASLARRYQPRLTAARERLGIR